MPKIPEQLEHPQAWLWHEDGPIVHGTHVRFDEATLDGRTVGIHVLEVDGAERSVWAFYKAIESKIGDELARRPAGDLDEGELVRYERCEKRESANGRTYFPFKATFGNAAEYKRKPREIFKPSAADDDETNPEQTGDGDGDSIPF